MNKEEYFISKLKDKNWKTRQEAYTELGSELSKTDEHRHLIKIFQDETNIPALESAIDCILTMTKPPEVQEIHKIFNHIGNTKTSIKTRIHKLVMFVASAHTNDVVNELCATLKHKAPKNVASAVTYLVEIVSVYDCDMSSINVSLDLLFNHSDKNVRTEAFKLAIEVHKKIGNIIKDHLHIKPIQMKELEDEFAKSAPAVETKKCTDISFDKVNDAKWSVRLEGLTEIRDACSYLTITNELVTCLMNKINDPNIQVFYMVLEIIKSLKLKNTRITNKLIERLKDKKQVVTDKIKDCLITVGIDGFNTDYLQSKSPELRVNLIDVCMKTKSIDEEIIRNVVASLSYSSAQVRAKAMEFCMEMEFDKSCLPADVKKKIMQKSVSQSPKNKIVQEDTVKNDVISDKIRKQDEHSSIHNSHDYKHDISVTSDTVSIVSDDIKSVWFAKYSFFKEKAWKVRLEEAKNNERNLQNEDLMDMCNFILQLKDPNFMVNEYLIDLLLQRDDLTSVDTLCCQIIAEKITDTKLRHKLLELAKMIDKHFVVNFMIDKILVQKCKQGKVFVEIVKFLKEICSYDDHRIEELFCLKGTGLQEIRALDELKCHYVSICRQYEVQNVSYSSEHKTDIVHNCGKVSVDNELSVFKVEKRNLFERLQNDVVVNLVDYEEIFTQDFVRQIREGNFCNVISILHDDEKSAYIRLIILYYIQNELPSTYFNSLIIFSITNKYILTDHEAQILVSYLLEQDMKEEVEMIDRIYPVTKLYKILQIIKSDSAYNEIIRLVEKYGLFSDVGKKIICEDKEKLRSIIDKCDDFLSMVDQVNGISTPLIVKPDVAKRLLSRTNSPCVRHKLSLQEPKGMDNNQAYNNSVLQDDAVDSSVFDSTIEASLECLNLTPKTKKFRDINKYREQFNSPVKNVNNLEEILDHLIDSNQEKSEAAFKKLLDIINTDIESVLFFANSVISSISIQLLDVMHRPLYADIIINVLFVISKSKIFCQQIRKETIESLHIDLINILQNSKNSKEQISDILINFCQNAKPFVILDAYLDILTKQSAETPLKLVWKHSKTLEMTRTEDIQSVLNVLENFYKKNVFSDLLDNLTTFKVVTLHLKDICGYYETNVMKFTLGRYTKIMCTAFLDKRQMTVSTLRKIK